MAFTSIAALAAATAETVTVTMVLGAVAEVGMAMTVVGAVTGSKDLMKIGGTMGLIGGVGGMVAGAFSGATSAAASGLSEAATNTALESASTEAANAFGGAAGAEAATANTIAGMEGAASSGLESGIMDNVASAVGDQSIFGNAAANPGAQMGAGPSSVQDLPKSAAQQVEDKFSAATDVKAPAGPEAVQAPQTPYDVSTDPNSTPTDKRLASGTAKSPATAPQDAGSYFNRLSAFAEKNKTLFSGGMQVMGGALKGMSERQMWDEKMALDRDRLAQTQYGSHVARFQPRGIVQGAAK